MKKTITAATAAIFAAVALMTSCSPPPETAASAGAVTRVLANAGAVTDSGTGTASAEYSTALTEITTGTPLRSVNADKRRPIASITKEMVLLLACERINGGQLALSDTVTVTARAAAADGATIWLEKGEKMSVSDLIKAVVIASANDAAVALAEHMYGSEAAAVAAMNARAAALGMYDTRFAGAAGFDSPAAYSTAADVAVMTAELFRDGNYALLKGFMLTRLSSVRTGTAREAQLLNTNTLAGGYNGLLGGKTGTTDGAGYCLAAVASRGGITAVAVVLGASDNDTRVQLARRELDTAFTSFELYAPAEHYDKTKLTEIPVVGGTDKLLEVTTENTANAANAANAANTALNTDKIVIPKGASARIKYTYYRPPQVTAPVGKGQPLGTIIAELDGAPVYETYIVAARGMGRLTYAYCLDYVLRGLMR